MTRADCWKKRPIVLRYWAFCDEVKEAGITLNNANDHLIFHVPMPKSWSKKKKKRMAGTPHQQRPDLDNYVKALFDSVMSEDCFVYHFEASKFWAVEGAIEVMRKQ